jgi:hypothetical protein
MSVAAHCGGQGPIRSKLLELLDQGVRLPVKDLQCPGNYAVMTQACFLDQADRPTFDEMLEQLKKMLQRL